MRVLVRYVGMLSTSTRGYKTREDIGRLNPWYEEIERVTIDMDKSSADNVLVCSLNVNI
jgi:hypothetical protein